MSVRAEGSRDSHDTATRKHMPTSSNTNPRCITNILGSVTPCIHATRLRSFDLHGQMEQLCVNDRICPDFVPAVTLAGVVGAGVEREAFVGAAFPHSDNTCPTWPCAASVDRTAGRGEMKCSQRARPNIIQAKKTISRVQHTWSSSSAPVYVYLECTERATNWTALEMVSTTHIKRKSNDGSSCSLSFH